MKKRSLRSTVVSAALMVLLGTYGLVPAAIAQAGQNATQCGVAQPPLPEWFQQKCGPEYKGAMDRASELESLSAYYNGLAAKSQQSVAATRDRALKAEDLKKRALERKAKSIELANTYPGDSPEYRNWMAESAKDEADAAYWSEQALLMQRQAEEETATAAKHKTEADRLCNEAATVRKQAAEDCSNRMKASDAQEQKQGKEDEVAAEESGEEKAKQEDDEEYKKEKENKKDRKDKDEKKYKDSRDDRDSKWVVPAIIGGGIAVKIFKKKKN